MATAIKKILVPLDGSKCALRALDVGIQHATANKAKLTIISAIASIGLGLARAAPPYSEQFLREEAGRILAAGKRKVPKSVKLDKKIIYGTPGRSIVSYAGKNKVNLIVMGSRGLGSVKEAFLGSTSHYVVQKAKAQVLIVK